MEGWLMENYEYLNQFIHSRIQNVYPEYRLSYANRSF